MLKLDKPLQAIFPDKEESASCLEPLPVFLKLLGEGAHSKVYLTEQGTAVKLVRVDKDILPQVLNDLQILQELAEDDSGHFVKFIGIHWYDHQSDSKITEDSKGLLYDMLGIEMEACLEGDLFDYVKREGKGLSEHLARPLFKQLCESVLRLHALGRCHRDLKPENVLLTRHPDGELRVRLSDFGLSAPLVNNKSSDDVQSAYSMLTDRCGSEEYASPEVILGTPYNGSLADMWSLGCILYVILCGRMPFDLRSGLRSMNSRILQGLYPKINEDVSPGGKDLIGKLLKDRPEDRYTVTQALSHPWLSE